VVHLLVHSFVPKFAAWPCFFSAFSAFV
jgi:hypothetical protein